MYLLIAVRYVGLAVSVIAPVAVGAGVVAARIAEPGDTFAVVLGATVTCAFLSGILVAPDLRRRIGWRVARARTGQEPSDP
jgi:hypothetical protein